MRCSGLARALPFAVSAILLVQPVLPSYAQEAARARHKEARREALAGHHQKSMLLLLESRVLAGRHPDGPRTPAAEFIL